MIQTEYVLITSTIELSIYSFFKLLKDSQPDYL